MLILLLVFFLAIFSIYDTIFRVSFSVYRQYIMRVLPDDLYIWGQVL